MLVSVKPNAVSRKIDDKRILALIGVRGAANVHWTFGHRFARYADDLLVLVNSERAGQRVKASLTRWLDRKLKLPVNEQKSQVAKLSEVTFLGFCFRGTKLRGSDAALDDFSPAGAGVCRWRTGCTSSAST